jgi:hypothetical protein
MARERLLPGDPFPFIQDCIRHGRVLWTDHQHAPRRPVQGGSLPRALDNLCLPPDNSAGVETYVTPDLID